MTDTMSPIIFLIGHMALALLRGLLDFSYNKYKELHLVRVYSHLQQRT